MTVAAAAATVKPAARTATIPVKPTIPARPVTPLNVNDLDGASGSDDYRTVAELMQQGYADAYRHFIEPVVAAGDRLEVI